MSFACRLIVLAAFAILSGPAFGQATTRACGPEEAPGPACLLTRADLAVLPQGELFWHLDTFPSKAEAEAAAGPSGSVAEAFGKVWLFTIERKDWQARGATSVAVVGPLPVQPAPSYAAEYLRSVFSPGMKAPVHVHSGPEAFYAISGETCLETPQGVLTGNGFVVPGGPPMLLMAVGSEPRRGFALILHDRTQPPTTLTEDWRPKGLCEGHR